MLLQRAKHCACLWNDVFCGLAVFCNEMNSTFFQKNIWWLKPDYLIWHLKLPSTGFWHSSLPNCSIHRCKTDFGHDVSWIHSWSSLPSPSTDSEGVFLLSDIPIPTSLNRGFLDSHWVELLILICSELVSLSWTYMAGFIALQVEKHCSWSKESIVHL